MSQSEDKKEVSNKKRVLYKVLMIISICVLLFSLFQIGKKLYGYYNDNKKYEEIRTQVSSEDASQRFEKVFERTLPTNDIEPKDETEDEKDISVGSTEPVEPEGPVIPYQVDMGDIRELNDDGIFQEYSNLKKQNSDLIGWIQMPGFKKIIDYPLMYSGDNKYYLDRDFFNNYSYAGSIFIDSRNNPAQVDAHIIIYGHAMKDYSMFGNIKEYPKQPDLYTKNRYIYIDLLNTRMEYEVFSTYYADATYNYRQTYFSNEEVFLDFLERIQENSVYDFGTIMSPLDKIITLSTCTDSVIGNGRTVVHAKLVRQIVYNGDMETEGITTSPDQTVKKAVSANVYLLKLSLSYSTLTPTPEPTPEATPEPTQVPIEVVLDPPFNTIYREFEVELPPEADTISLDIVTADPLATFSITLNGEDVKNEELPIEYGENIINIRVISQDHIYARRYSIIVIRLMDEPAETEPPSESETEINSF